MTERKTVGQLVDDLADKYFASGMDSYTAGVRACLDVARCQIKLFDELPALINRFVDGLVKAPVQENSADEG